MLFIATCFPAFTGSSLEANDTVGSLAVSCDVDPDGVAVQYSCDSAATSGECVDYLEGFATSTMDVT